MTIRIVPYKEARLEHFKAQRERRRKTLHWWKYQKPGKQYDQQTIWEMCADLGNEISYLDDVVAMLEKEGEGKRMTDEQANNITREQAIRILHPDTSIEAIDDYEEAGNYEHAYDTACLMAVAALRGSQPDPETGLVPCGCGGKAKIWPSDLRQATDYEVGCTECAMTTGWVRGKQENAIKVWNTAMGWKGSAECGTDGANIIRHISGKIRIDIPPGNDSVRASTGFQRDGGDKTERRCNQCIHCGQEMPEGDQVCGYCRRQHGY